MEHTLIYLVATLALGIFCGLVVPRKWRSFWVLLAFGFLFLAIGLAMAVGYSYGASGLVDLFTLTGELDKGILIQFVVIGYASIVGALVSAFRYLFRKSDERRTSGS